MSTPQPLSPPRWPIALGGFVVGLSLTVLAALMAVLVYFVAAGGPLADEWECSKGEYPATSPAGGGDCFTYGEPMPRGWTAYPKGNQPLGVQQ